MCVLSELRGGVCVAKWQPSGASERRRYRPVSEDGQLMYTNTIETVVSRSMQDESLTR